MVPSVAPSKGKRCAWLWPCPKQVHTAPPESEAEDAAVQRHQTALEGWLWAGKVGRTVKLTWLTWILSAWEPVARV